MAPPLKPLRELSYVPLADVAADATFRLRHPGDVSSLARSIAQVGQLFPVDVRETEAGLQPLAGFRRLEALRILQRSRVLVRNHGPIPDAAAATLAAAAAIDSRALELEDLRELRDRYEAMGWATPSLLELIGRSIEKEEERLEDLEAKLKGEAPPDRSIPDEDGDDDRAPAGAAGDERIAAGAHAEAGSGAAERNDDRRPADARAEAGSAAAAAEGDGAGAAPAGVAPGARDGAAPLQVRAEIALEPLPLEPPAAALLAEVGAAGHGEVTPDALARQIAARLSETTQDLAALAEHWSLVPAGLRNILADQLDYYRRLGSWLGQEDGDDK
ncbi:MAG TPA: ParB/RepB/Spo0J family partition protein [Vulgatibacter sp.]|nr:ParB/RepB/Spo0J family partition protein [Vulgatibacter sp.]